MQALDESVPLKYEPTYLRDEEEEGQDEEGNPEDALVIERCVAHPFQATVARVGACLVPLSSNDFVVGIRFKC